MSQKVRRQIAYWIMFLLGIGLLSLQFKKYFEDTLELSPEEFIVTMVAVVLTINPMFFIESLAKFINSKYGKNTDES